MDKKLYLVVEGRLDVMSVIFFDISRGLDEELDAVTKELVSEIKLYEEDSGADKRGNPRRIIDLGGKLQRARAKAVVFAAMCLEAFIYDFASNYLGDTYVRNNLDRLGFLPKWAVIPKLALGKGLREESQASEHLKLLLKERNDLVHAKSMSVPTPTGTDKEFAKAIMSKMMPRTERRLKRQATCPKPHRVVVEVLTALGEIEFAEVDTDRWWELTECPPRLLSFLSEIGLGHAS